MTKNTPKSPEFGRTQWARIALFLAVVAGLFLGIDPDEIGAQLAQASFQEIGWFFLAYSGVQFLRCLRFYALNPAFQLGTLFSVSALHVFYLRILPLRAGEVAYALLLKRANMGTQGEGLAHLALTRILDMGLVGAAGLLGWTLSSLGSSNQALQVAAGILTLLALSSFFVLPRLFNGAHRLMVGLSSRAPVGLSKLLSKGGVALEEAAQCATHLPPRRIVLATLVSLGLWACAFLVMKIALEMVGVSIPSGSLLLAGSATVVASFIPIGLIGTFGVLETGWMLGFGAVGVSTSESLASAVLYSAFTLAAAIVYALVAHIHLKRVNRPETEE